VPRGEMVRVFFVLIVGTAIGGVIFSATTIAMPKLFEERLSEITSSVSGIGLFVFVVYTLAAVAQMIIGTLADRMPLGRLLVPVTLVQIPLLLLAGMMGGVSTLFIAIPMMFLVFGLIPINEVMVARYTPPEYRTRIYSVRYTLAFGSIAAAIPTVAWLHSNYGGFAQLFMLLGALAVPLTLAAFLLLFTERQAEGGTAQPASA
jgi:MFS family permease